MKHTNTPLVTVLGCFALLSLLLLFQSCREDLEGTYPVIKEELVGDYLENHPEYFSEFTQMLNKTGVMGLLKAYGKYTVFAPTNDAMERYYRFLSKEKSETITSQDQLSIAEMREICYNHIIRGDALRTKDFHEGILSTRSMSDRFYSVTYTDSAIVINDYSPIVSRDNMFHNGIVHVLSEAITPAPGAIAEVFEKDSLRFSIYVKALKATGLYRYMNKAKVEDESYNYTFGYQPDPYNLANPESKPTSRKFGYTILAVSDADLANYVDEAAGLPNGIHSLADLEKLARYHYGIAFDHDADNITDRTNSKHYLNRFMSYHCFNRVLYSSLFVKDLFTPHHFPQYPMPEYIETMLENTIVEVLMDKQGKLIGPARAADPRSAFGVFNFDDPAQGAMLTEIKDKPSGGAMNGYYHGITRPIMYTKTLSTALSSKRLRMDVATFFPELTTNNMRGSNPTADFYKKWRCWVIEDKYLDDYEANPNTELIYVAATDLWEYYQGDILLISGYNFTLRTCPIPAGTYEVRLANDMMYDSGLCQYYLDSIPCGMPFSRTLQGKESSLIGFEVPGTNPQDPEGYENDKNLRNHRFMKGPITFKAPSTKVFEYPTARHSPVCLRYILGTFTFKKTEKHYLTAINLDGKSYTSLDYIEFCPVNLIETEGID